MEIYEPEDAAVEDIFCRPVLQLRSLSTPIRWEVTRRHTSYQVYWRECGDDGLDHLTLNDEQKRRLLLYVRQVRKVALAKIGVNYVETVDPAKEFKSLCDSESDFSWLAGSVQPVSMRGLASLLGGLLPKNTLTAVGMALVEAGLDDVDGEEPSRLKALAKLANLQKEGLDHLPPEPFVSINPAASGRQVFGEIKGLLRSWKETLDIGDLRDRSSKHRTYLEVWDMREGWQDGAYNAASQKKYAEIAKLLKSPLPTIQSRYKMAFQIITGHPYSWKNWATCFGPLKIGQFGNDLTALMKRPMIERSSPDVPDSAIQAKSDDVEFSEAHSATDDQQLKGIDMLMDIASLIEAGYSDDQIINKLELSQDQYFQIDDIRDRQIG